MTTPTAPSKDKPEQCSVEIYRRTVPGAVNLSYYVSEVPPVGSSAADVNPLDIISWDQDYIVHVDVELPNSVRRMLCGCLCVNVDIDTCGPAPDVELGQVIKHLDPCGDGKYHFEVPIKAGTFAPGDNDKWGERCGRIYTICVTLGSTDACGRPGLIWGHCASLQIAVHPPVQIDG